MILFSILLFASCDDPNKDNMVPAIEEYPISTWLSMNSEEFSEWISLLEYTDFYNTMNLNEGYTAFVPTNDAMIKFLSANSYSSVESIPYEDARLLVKFHTIRGMVYTQNEFGNGLLPDSTASGDYLSIEFSDKIYVNNEAAIEQVDVSVTNGVLHTLDAVLNPVNATIWDIINSSEYSIMAEAVQLTGHKEIFENLWNGTLRSQYTLLAVPNTVYNSYGINSVNDLTAQLGSSSDYSNPENALYQYVAYHALDQQYDISVLEGIPTEDASVNLAPMVAGQLINLSIHNTYLYFNYNEETETGTRITESNLKAKNGLVHVINTPLFIEIPPLATVIWEFTDYPELAGTVSDYRKSGLKNNSPTTLTAGEVNCYSWETTTVDQMNSAVTYTAYANTNIQYDFLNYDALVLNLRLFGWIQMETPTIVKGKYTIRLNHYSASSSSMNGKMRLIIDGAYIGNELTLNGHSTTSSSIMKTNVGSIEFDETTTHTVRILQTDAASITLDYLEFVPVE